MIDDLFSEPLPSIQEILDQWGPRIVNRPTTLEVI